MGDVTTIPPTSVGAVAKVRQLESMAGDMPQVPIATEHTFHAGIYARTIMIPAGVMLTGALIKIATVLIVSGNAIVYMDGEPSEVAGYVVLAASAGRKQAFVALSDTYLTMAFPTDAETIDQAEREFTDEFDLLMSRHVGARNDLTAEE
jgi:hypothetical protein